jgi:hypothetical protein
MQTLTIEQIKAFYPNMWVLIANPVMDSQNMEVKQGIPLFFSKDKKEVCYLGREKTENYAEITLIFTGQIQTVRRLTGLFNRL